MTQLVQYVQAFSIPGLGVALLALLAKVARHYISRIEDDRLRDLLLQLVKAAEQIYGPGTGAVKLQYVQEQLAQRGYGDVSTAAIEAAVNDLAGKRAK